LHPSRVISPGESQADVPSRTRAGVLVLFLGLGFTGSNVARADGSPTPPSPADVLTHYESFVLTNCVPCVRESYYIATVPVPSINAPIFPGVLAQSTRAITRSAELRFELLRAYPTGLPSRGHMAMRAVLSVAAGAEDQLYPLGAGLLDEDEVPVLEAALSQMQTWSQSEATDPSAQLVDFEFHVDSVRVGTFRTEKQTLAYMQVAPTELPRFALKQIWELPTVFLASSDIPVLQRAVKQVNAKIRTIRDR
jgi:hypothetical protein